MSPITALEVAENLGDLITERLRLSPSSTLSKGTKATSLTLEVSDEVLYLRRFVLAWKGGHSGF